MSNIPPWAGKNARIVLNLDDTEVKFRVKSWEIERVLEHAEDDFCGEDRTDSQEIVKYFNVSLAGAETKLEMIEALIDAQKSIDDNAGPLAGWIGFMITANDGTKHNLLGSEMSIGGWKIGNSSRIERNAVDLPLRFKYIEGLPGL
jgi:hypothetical protein